jgi:hypothetical protein
MSNFFVFASPSASSAPVQPVTTSAHHIFGGAPPTGGRLIFGAAAPVATAEQKSQRLTASVASIDKNIDKLQKMILACTESARRARDERVVTLAYKRAAAVTETLEKLMVNKKLLVACLASFLAGDDEMYEDACRMGLIEECSSVF